MSNQKKIDIAIPYYKLITPDITHNNFVYKLDPEIIFTTPFTDKKQPPEFDRTKTYYKCLRQDLTHHGFKYQVGLNVDTIAFNPTGSCQPGGLYFTDKENLHEYFNHGYLIADIRIPKDAKVYQDPEEYKWKADKIEILSITPRCFHSIFNSYEYWLGVVQKKGYALEFTPEEFKDHYICLIAVRKSGYAMNFVPLEFKTKELYKVALQDDGCYLMNVPEELKDLDICLVAVRQDGLALQFVPTNLLNYELCSKAVAQNGFAFQYVPDKIKDEFICMLAVQQRGGMLYYVPNHLKTKQICMAAVRQCKNNIIFVPEHLKKEIEDVDIINSSSVIYHDKTVL
jgi:hypothetical protein